MYKTINCVGKVRCKDCSLFFISAFTCFAFHISQSEIIWFITNKEKGFSDNAQLN